MVDKSKVMVEENILLDQSLRHLPSWTSITYGHLYTSVTVAPFVVKIIREDFF
jgi:hypothetical protein